MKVKVYDFRCVNNNYWVNCVYTRASIDEEKKQFKYEDTLLTLRVSKDLFEKSIKVPVNFPLVLDVKFEKGVGIKSIKTL